MAVVDVRIVRVCVHERLVPVRVAVWFARRVGGRVVVVVVLVVNVHVLVLHGFVPMLVFVPLGDV